MAIEVARAVLSDDQQAHPEACAALRPDCLDEVQPTAAKTVYVHPTCTMPIIRWLAQTRNNTIEVKKMISVSPGDCRIESGECRCCRDIGSVFDFDSRTSSAWKEPSCNDAEMPRVNGFGKPVA